MDQIINNNLTLIRTATRGDFANCIKHIKGLKSVLLTINKLALTKSEFNKVVQGCYTLKMSEKALYEAQTEKFKASYSANKFKALLQMVALTGAIKSAAFEDLSYAERAKRVKSYEVARQTGHYVNYPRVWIIGDLSVADFSRIKGHKPLALNYTAVASIFGMDVANQVFNDASSTSDSDHMLLNHNPAVTISKYLSVKKDGLMPVTDVADLLYRVSGRAKSQEYWQKTLRVLIEYNALPNIEAVSLGAAGLSIKGLRKNTKVLRLIDPVSTTDNTDDDEPLRVQAVYHLNLEKYLDDMQADIKKAKADKAKQANDDKNDITVTDEMLPF
ncbi:hypothetical protein [Lactiplantibacillus plantarum]|uniref:hypothetical protein n=1 Tax=Lactiplantibacillus plantarum TaxID=1590 RepID=UPI002ED7A8E7|nr:hypothetical protein [Lactiplantibacillus plantarum]MCG0817001.1 hypothetical protein [Lactiplantibacillus plantarum]MCG0842072.1 hypothetical protein [Lactiplantibacillus plantarum]MCG0939165.1 hypothetical protein [Lactiplantibacillus plantarum]MCG0948756.1 hypothetical protein [Lactiplantibacillus plantarum]